MTEIVEPLNAAVARLEALAAMDDQDKHEAARLGDQEGKAFSQGRANGLRTAINYIKDVSRAASSCQQEVDEALILSLEHLLVEEDRMHPIGCSTWIVEAHYVVEHVAERLRNLP